MFATAPSDVASPTEVPAEEPPATWAAIESIKVGEYVRRSPTAHRTFIRGKYDQRERRYELRDTEDLNRSIWLRKGTNLVVGFTY